MSERARILCTILRSFTRERPWCGKIVLSPAQAPALYTYTSPSLLLLDPCKVPIWGQVEDLSCKSLLTVATPCALARCRNDNTALGRHASHSFFPISHVVKVEKNPVRLRLSSRYTCRFHRRALPYSGAWTLRRGLSGAPVRKWLQAEAKPWGR